MNDKPRCTGINKKGQPCAAPPRRGESTCISHSPREVQESAGFGGSQPGAGRPRLPKPVERMRELVEEEIETLLAPYFAAARDAVLTANYEGQVMVSQVPDLGARMAAVEKLLDRVYGKPRQATEITGADGGPVQVEPMDLSGLSRDELRQMRELMVKARADT